MVRGDIRDDGRNRLKPCTSFRDWESRLPMRGRRLEYSRVCPSADTWRRARQTSPADCPFGTVDGPSAIRAELINGGLLDAMAGGKTVDEIDCWLLFQFRDPNLKITGKEYVIPCKMLQKTWVDAQISYTAYTGNSKVVQILKENDIKTDWGLKSPMLLVHSDADDAVPYENSKIVMANFSSKPTFITIPKLGHWNAAYVANPIALGWIAKKLNID